MFFFVSISKNSLITFHNVFVGNDTNDISTLTTFYKPHHRKLKNENTKFTKVRNILTDTPKCSSGPATQEYFA